MSITLAQFEEATAAQADRMFESDSVTVTAHVQEVKLLKTTFNDTHVKAIISHVTGGDATKEAAIRHEVETRIKNFECVAAASPVLYEAALDNIIESVLFDKFWAHDKAVSKKDLHAKIKPKVTQHPGHVERAPEVTTAPKFDKITFMSLVSKVKAESKSFFPLRNMIDFHVIKNPRISVSGEGDPKLSAQLEAVDTAAATADGTFVFNNGFCQALLDFAHLKGLKAGPGKHGKKYKSKGGDIPDEWEYIEFVIRHEFMHYTYSDFHYRKIIPGATGKLINWVGDFRTNHRLIQQGLNQLPMGLFSSYVNFHKQSSYSEMYNLVKSEFSKLSDECKEELSDELENSTDEHSEGGNDSEGNPKPSDKTIKPEDLDRWNKKQDEKAKADAADDAPPDYDTKPPDERNPGDGKGGRHEIDYKSISPKYKWDALLKKMVGESSYVMDQSYQKISRRAIGTMQQVITRGQGAVKPGDVKNPSKKKIKLAVIVDSSGSMSYVIHTVMSNLDKLLVQRQGVTGVHDEFFLLIFSGDYDIYECTPGKGGTANHITDVDKKTPGPSGKLHLTDVLSHHKSGGTVFSSELAGQIKKLASRGYNCLVVSDGDMLHGDNFTNFQELYSGNRKHVWLLLDSATTFASFTTKMKEVSNNASHL